VDNDDSYILAKGQPKKSFWKKFFSRRSARPPRRSEIFAAKRDINVFQAERSRRGSRSRLWWIVGLSLLGIIAAGSSYFAFFSGNFTLRDIIVVNESQYKTLEEAKIMNQLVDHKGQNLFLLSGKTLAQLVLNKNPRLKSVEVEKVYPQSIKVIIEEYKITALFKELNSGTEQLVNEAGLIVPTVPIAEQASLIKLEVSLPEPKKVGELAIPRLDMLFIQTLQKKLLETFAGLTIARVHYYPLLNEVRVLTDPGFELWFDLGRKLENSLQDLYLIMDQGKLGEQKFSYIDLRIPGKAFVCMQEKC